jgi:hypothetical protein
MEARRFAKEDYVNLFEIKSYDSRLPYVARIKEGCENLCDYPVFEKTLEKIGSPMVDWVNAREFCGNKDNQKIILKRLLTSRPDVEDPELLDLISLLSDHLQSFSWSELNLMVYMAQYHEKLALVTLEPYMIFILGHAFFLKYFAYLHEEGVACAIITQAVSQQKKTSSFFRPYSENVTRIGTFVSNVNFKHLGSFAFLGSFSISIAHLLLNKPVPSVTFTDITQQTFQKLKGSGLGSAKLNKLIEFMGKVSYEIGRAMSTIPQNLYKGGLSNFEGPALEAAKNLDTLAKKK